MLEARTLWELIELRAEASGDELMAIDEERRRLSFRELRDEAERVAAGLRDLGIDAGTVVSWQLPTWLESMVLVAALSRLGAVQNPMLPIYRQREVSFITRQAGAKLLVVPSVWRGFDFEAMADEVASSVGGLGVLVTDKALPEGDPTSLPPPPSPPPTPDDAPVRWLFYTSGTTADPKGAQHTDATIMASSVGMAERLAMTADDRSAMVFPFTHIGGITWMFTSLLTGCQLVFVEAFDPKATPDVLQREGVTVAGAGTVFHMAYLNAQRERPEGPLFPNLRVCVGGGAPKPPQLHHDVKRELGGAGIASGYGLTEAPIITMASVDDDDDALANTEGRATRGVELRVVKLDGSIASVGEEGEIRAKAPQLMRGYLDSSLDAEAFDDDGWFRTGDLGRLDDRGNVTITGRLKDIIIRKGENISAKEVEDLLFTHPKIADVAVIGLPDPSSGERCCAVVVAADPDDPPTLADIADFCRAEGLMTQKIPEQLEIVDVLPRNPTGKVLKFELRDRYAKEG
jgi:acyl-CoA synthetase (AMP-forming)/AMP-acid ligase II